MTETEARAVIWDILSGIAPEADPAGVAGDEDCARRSISTRWTS